MRLLWAVMLLLLAFGFSFAATIHGTVYDADTLDVASRAIVEIDTVPAQTQVAQNGEYEFFVPVGNYTLTAKKMNSTEPLLENAENIEVRDNGTYNVDLFLFPLDQFDDLNESGSQITNESGEIDALIKENDAQQQLGQQTVDVLQIAVVAILLAAVAYYAWNSGKGKMRPKGEKPQTARKAKNAKKDELVLTPDQKLVADALRKSGGHATQKELRKAIPYSEAKVSLLITELEEMGAVKKFKRGRGNIVKLLK
jgi:uncharacterized membrane protein